MFVLGIGCSKAWRFGTGKVRIRTMELFRVKASDVIRVKAKTSMEAGDRVRVTAGTMVILRAAANLDLGSSLMLGLYLG